MNGVLPSAAVQFSSSGRPCAAGTTTLQLVMQLDGYQILPWSANASSAVQAAIQDTVQPQGMQSLCLPLLKLRVTHTHTHTHTHTCPLSRCEQPADGMSRGAGFTVDGVSLQTANQLASGGRRLAQVNQGPLQTAIVSATVGLPTRNVQAFTGKLVHAEISCQGAANLPVHQHPGKADGLDTAA